MIEKMDAVEIETMLQQLNYRWRRRALLSWKGEASALEEAQVYEGCEDFLNLRTLSRIDAIQDAFQKHRLRYCLIDHLLQQRLMPHENELRTWQRGASAEVDNEKVYFNEIIPWCQKSSTYEKRRVLEKETSGLCKFLSPFALNCWEVLLNLLHDELGVENYVDYCRQKKNIDYSHYYKLLRRLLSETDELYWSAMDRWSRKRFKRPLKALSRFDGMNLLSLSEFDTLVPAGAFVKSMSFFRRWQMDLDHIPGLHLEIGNDGAQSTQALCLVLKAPEEVYVLMRPEGGWIDIETLWHELGHGLSAVFTSSSLSVVEREMATSSSLSEAFAFLVQNIVLSAPFLQEYIGLDSADSTTIVYYKVLRDLAVFRRYAAKFLIEYEMFTMGDISNGDRYTEKMNRYTGFYYQPESHLFDLTPEFYSLDYILGWMTEAILETYLDDRLGHSWMFDGQTGSILRHWWHQGNRLDIAGFLEHNDLGTLSHDHLLRRWRTVLKA